MGGGRLEMGGIWEDWMYWKSMGWEGGRRAQERRVEEWG